MLLNKLSEEFKNDHEYIFEGLKISISEEIARLMKEKGVNKKQLAQKMKVSPAYITKVLGAENISLKVIAKILSALEINGNLNLKIEAPYFKQSEEINFDGPILNKSSFYKTKP